MSKSGTQKRDRVVVEAKENAWSIPLCLDAYCFRTLLT